jgi:hypothetical protein
MVEFRPPVSFEGCCRETGRELLFDASSIRCMREPEFAYQQAAGNAIAQQFGRPLVLWSADEDEESQYLQADSDVANGPLNLDTGAQLFWHYCR